MKSHIQADRSRSTWACELKYIQACPYRLLHQCHAPRERVSWNIVEQCKRSWRLVTLHVSVWVEIRSPEYITIRQMVTLHVSVWVEILYKKEFKVKVVVTLHVSVWVEIYKKCATYVRLNVTLHVSVWVEILFTAATILFITVTLHVSVWVEICDTSLTPSCWKSRSTWACELKCVYFRLMWR